MSENAHTYYFGQSLPHVQPEGSGQQSGSGEGIQGQDDSHGQTQTDSTLGTQMGTNNAGGRIQTTPITPIDRTQARTSHATPAPGGSGQSFLREFRADLVTRMDDVIQKFRDRKASKVEALFQILQVIREGNLNESDERTTLEQYTSHIELIDGQHELAGQRGERTTGARQDGRERTNDTELERHTHQRGVGPEIQDAEHFLRALRTELVKKRKRRHTSVSSQSSEESDDERGEGETNKKKRVYQSQLPWYATEVEAQGREVDKN
jgi:hypothetical protein